MSSLQKMNTNQLTVSFTIYINIKRRKNEHRAISSKYTSYIHRKRRLFQDKLVFSRWHNYRISILKLPPPFKFSFKISHLYWFRLSMGEIGFAASDLNWTCHYNMYTKEWPENNLVALSIRIYKYTNLISPTLKYVQSTIYRGMLSNSVV